MGSMPRAGHRRAEGRLGELGDALATTKRKAHVIGWPNQPSSWFSRWSLVSPWQ